MSGQKNILLLGAGFVAHPTLSVLVSRPENHVTVACRTLEKAQKFIGDLKNATPARIDVENEQQLEEAVSKHDLVISLIPYIHHVKVIKAAIKHKKNVCTTSYVSDAIRELEPEAKKAGVIVMNEIGVDPGVDHLYAVKTISEVHEQGGKVTGFISYCGGLPAPECANNPLGYKFSWSSRGVLLAVQNAARYYQDGNVVSVAGQDLMAVAKPYTTMPNFDFVCYPNRDSTAYRQLYNIPEAGTVIRGTLRYKGFPDFIRAITALGFLSQEHKDFLDKPISWAEAFAQVIGAPSSRTEDIENTVTEQLVFATNDVKNQVLDGMRWLELLSPETKITPRGTPLDTLCAQLEQKMQYGPNERDMLCLQHQFQIQKADGSNEVRTSTLVDYGEPNGYSAMAKLVGVPCGIACQQILDGVINTPGVLAPLNTKLNQPIIEDLKKRGIFMVEDTLPVA